MPLCRSLNISFSNAILTPAAEPAVEPAAEDGVAAPASDASADGKHDPPYFSDCFTVDILDVM